MGPYPDVGSLHDLHRVQNLVEMIEHKYIGNADNILPPPRPPIPPLDPRLLMTSYGCEDGTEMEKVAGLYFRIWIL